MGRDCNLYLSFISLWYFGINSRLLFQIMGDITGSLDAKKALTEALKIHKKYLNKARITS